MDAPPAFGSPPAFGFQDLFNHVIGDMAKAVCHRNGESEERRYQRLQAAVQMIMGFMPRDVIEAMLAGHCVMFHELIVDSVRHTLLGEVDTMRRATRGGIVAMDKSFRGNLDQLGHFQLRPSTGRRDVAESVAAAELRPEQNADPAMADASLADASLADASLADVSLGEAVRAEFQAAGMRAAGNAPAGPRADRPGPDTAPALTDGSVEPGLDGDYLGRDEHHPDRAGSHSGRDARQPGHDDCRKPAGPLADAVSGQAVRVELRAEPGTPAPPGTLVFTPSAAAIAACQANPEAMAALDAGDPERFARALGLDQPDEGFLAAATAPGSPFRPDFQTRAVAGTAHKAGSGGSRSR
jgi:hypothetical protein